ncbi:MAG TPA: hypothetical protein PKH77_06920 [Anaerolineae bacterium]|nr:hypothetical protein [Anaerolineae bacterium]
MNSTHLIALGLVLSGAVALAVFGIRYRDKTPTFRHFPVFSALAGEVGRAAEQGVSIHVALGNGGLATADAMTSVAALEGVRALLELSAAYDTPPLITTGDPTLYLLASDWLRRAYTRVGAGDLFRPTMVQFAAPTPTTYAAMAATQLFDAPIGANVMLGAFNQEVSLLTEAARRRGVASMGGVVSLPGIGALYPALEQTQLVIGEELFVGGALVKERSVSWASLSAQETLRWLVIAGILITAVLSLLR